MIVLKDVLEKSKKYLEQKGFSDARRSAEEIIAHCLALPRIELYMRFDQPLEECELIEIREKLSRRAKREPLQYIEGEVSFYQSTFKLMPDVLIPRPETEQLVEKIVQQLKGENLKGKVLWDLCTGTGCIGISLKKEFPELRVILTDLSSSALALAKKNAEGVGVEVECHLGDLFGAFSAPVDFLVSNPPYVSQVEYESLQPEVKLYEPKMALVPGPSGLEIYEKVAKELKHVLKPGAKAWFEMGSSQKNEIKKLFEADTEFKILFERDYAGLDRFFSLELE